MQKTAVTFYKIVISTSAAVAGCIICICKNITFISAPENKKGIHLDAFFCFHSGG
jgi:hypothetical protein